MKASPNRIHRRLARKNRPPSDGEIDPRRVIQIHAIAEPSGTWLHTHGLRAHALPELEIRDAPTWTLRPGARLLNAVAHYLLNSGKQVRLGEAMELDEFGLFTFRAAEPREPVLDHYDHERWTVVSVDAALCSCEHCDARRQAATDSAD